MGEGKRRQAVRVQTAAAIAKQLAQYEALKADGRVRRAMVIAELDGGDYHVLGQGMSLDQMAPALVAAAEGIAQAKEHRVPSGSTLRLDPDTVQASERGRDLGRAGPARRERAVTRDVEGELHAPAGEHFMFCGECGNARWFVLSRNEDERLTRCSCTHCGNEVVMIALPGPISPPGTA